MILRLQTQITIAKAQLEDREAYIAVKDVRLFAREAELTAVMRERDDAVDRVMELQDRV